MRGKLLAAVGIVLAIAGAVALAVGGIPYTDSEEILEVGPIEASAEVEKTIEIPPLAAGLSLAAGVGLIIAGVRARGG